MRIEILITATSNSNMKRNEKDGRKNLEDISKKNYCIDTLSDKIKKLH